MDAPYYSGLGFRGWEKVLPERTHWPSQMRGALHRGVSVRTVHVCASMNDAFHVID
jgi:hypothetical protein